MNEGDMQAAAAKPADTDTPRSRPGLQCGDASGPRGTGPGGRHRWAILLGLLGLAGGASAGWMSKEPLYRAEGLVYIEPALPSVQDPTGKEVLPLLEGFVALQVQILKSPSLTQLAMETEAWRKTGKVMSPEAIATFTERRGILHEKGNQHIQILFSDEKPEVALAGARAMIHAYERLVTERATGDALLMNARTQIEVLSVQVKEGSDRVRRLSADFGGEEGLQLRHTASVNQLIAAEQELAKLRIAIADAKQVGGSPDPTRQEQIAKEEALARRLRLLQQESQKLTKVRVELGEVKAQNEDVRSRLDKMKAAKEQLEAQLVGTGRIKLQDAGTLPTSPFEDGRKRFAAVFGALGCLAGVLIGLLLGLRGRPIA